MPVESGCLHLLTAVLIVYTITIDRQDAVILNALVVGAYLAYTTRRDLEAI